MVDSREAKTAARRVRDSSFVNVFGTSPGKLVVVVFRFFLQCCKMTLTASFEAKPFLKLSAEK